MANKVFAPKPGIPWNKGPKQDPAAVQPDPALGPYIVDYADATGKAARLVADWEDPGPDVPGLPGEVEIEWETVYRWIAVMKVP